MLHSVLHTAVRLVGGSTSSEGRVEVYYRGQWRRVCGTSSSFATDEATTVCRDLGYNSLIRRTTTYYGYIPGAAYISCNGIQSSLILCRVGTSLCSSSRRGQYVVCGNSSECMISFAKGTLVVHLMNFLECVCMCACMCACVRVHACARMCVCVS